MTRDEAYEALHSPRGRPTDPERRRVLEEWMERDAELRALDEEQADLFDALDDWTAPDPSSGFDAAVYARIEQESRPWYRRLFDAPAMPRWAAAGALTAAAAVLLWVGQEGPGQPEPMLKASVETPAADEYYEELDRALDDLEMLADFDVLAAPVETPEGRS